jgi:hypothetical protein
MVSGWSFRVRLCPAVAGGLRVVRPYIGPGCTGSSLAGVGEDPDALRAEGLAVSTVQQVLGRRRVLTPPAASCAGLLGGGTPGSSGSSEYRRAKVRTVTRRELGLGVMHGQ